MIGVTDLIIVGNIKPGTIILGTINLEITAPETNHTKISGVRITVPKRA
jgi:hypothetical protein